MKPRTIDQVRSERHKTVLAYKRLFTSPDAELVLKDLDARFNGTTLKVQGGVIDPYASIAAAGCREVLLYIDQIMETKTDAITD